MPYVKLQDIIFLFFSYFSFVFSLEREIEGVRVNMT